MSIKVASHDRACIPAEIFCPPPLSDNGIIGAQILYMDNVTITPLFPSSGTYEVGTIDSHRELYEAFIFAADEDVNGHWGKLKQVRSGFTVVVAGETHLIKRVAVWDRPFHDGRCLRHHFLHLYLEKLLVCDVKDY